MRMESHGITGAAACGSGRRRVVLRNSADVWVDDRGTGQGGDDHRVSELVIHSERMVEIRPTNSTRSFAVSRARDLS